MSNTLDNFWPDSRTALKECMVCGEGAERGELIPAQRDNYGVSLWRHKGCQFPAKPTYDGSVWPDFSHDTSADGTE